MASSPWVVIPTYNEAENLEAIVRAALAQLDACAPGGRVLVVDDASPDGTGELADQLATEDARIQVLHRQGKEGLGRAYLDAFGVALAGGADAVIEMDADFSHDPADLPRLLAALEDGADLALGSRYVAGGGVEDWGSVRRFVSRGGCRYAKRVLSVDVNDLTGGFKAFRRETLERIELDAVRAEGYAFQVELTYRALRRGLRVVEVPITFRDRRRGSSKMSPRIALEAIWLVPSVRMRMRSEERRAARRKPRGEPPTRPAILSEATTDSPVEH